MEKFSYSLNDEGKYIFDIPELKGKKINLFEIEALYEIIGEPDFEAEIDEDELEEYMEDYECDEAEALEELERIKMDEFYDNAPTIYINSVKDDNGLLDYIEVTIEDNYGYLEINDDKIEIVFDYIMSLVKLK